MKAERSVDNNCKTKSDSYGCLAPKHPQSRRLCYGSTMTIS